MAKRQVSVHCLNPGVQRAADFAVKEYVKRAPFSNSVKKWKDSTFECLSADRQLVLNDGNLSLNSKNYKLTLRLLSQGGLCAIHDVHVIVYRSGVNMIVEREVFEHDKRCHTHIGDYI